MTTRVSVRTLSGANQKSHTIDMRRTTTTINAITTPMIIAVWPFVSVVLFELSPRNGGVGVSHSLHTRIQHPPSKGHRTDDTGTTHAIVAKCHSEGQVNECRVQC
jgi:hypothetical protein